MTITKWRLSQITPANRPVPAQLVLLMFGLRRFGLAAIRDIGRADVPRMLSTRARRLVRCWVSCARQL
jgi:hypothetical protein